jgi:maleate cis-trans isomerase
MPDAVELGLICPGGGAEQEYYQFAKRYGRLSMYLVFSRFGEGEGHSIPSLLQTARIENLVEAARRLIPLRPQAVMYACTSGSFVVGRAGAEAQIHAIEKTVDSPAGSTSMAFIHALQHLGLKRVAVVATYPKEASAAFSDFLGEFGVSVVAMRYLGAIDGYAASEIPGDQIIAAAREIDVPEAEGLVIPDTALPSLAIIDPLEKQLGKPVLTANQVTIWEGLRLADALREQPDLGLGRLLAPSESLTLNA